jgi:hypothetical protein
MSSPYGNQGFGSRSLRPRNTPPSDPLRDPLTDSAVQRGVGMGTVVRFHLWGDTEPLDVHLLDLVGVATWYEVMQYVKANADIEVRPPHCIVIKGGAYRWVELIPVDEQD